MKARLHFLHVFPNFGPGGMELRAARIINGIGPSVRHTIVALGGAQGAREFIDTNIVANFPPAPQQTGSPFYFRQLQGCIRACQPDVLLTYNWGAIEGALAAWLGRIRPIVHHECGFGVEESSGLRAMRVWARRLVLRRVQAVAVTSRTMRNIAIQRFKLSAGKVHWIRTGVDVNRFRPGLSREWRREIGVRPDDLLIGFLGAFRPEKDLPLLIRAFSAARLPRAKLVLIGDGAGQPELECLARDLGIADAVIFPGRVADPARCLAALDVFALSSCTEQTSNALLEAMACGLPAVCTDPGDSREILDAAGPPVIVPAGDVRAYTEALTAIACSPELRAELGAMNRRRCLNHYPLGEMIQQYKQLYFEAYEKQRR
jgi:glycosyltransferase involved in cell wall biosynthesis